MGRWTRLLPLLLLLLVVPVIAQTPASENEQSQILIVEIQTGSTASATQEFIELLNQTDQPYPADELKLQYRSATGSDWLNKAQLEGNIEPRGRYLIATDDLSGTANFTTGLGLAVAGGHLRLIELAQDGEIVLDQVAWGTAQFALVTAAPAPAAGQSLKRLADEDGELIDTDNDNLDFVVSLTPSPESTPPIEEETNATPSPVPDTEPTETGGSTTTPNNEPSGQRNYSKLELSELFIDPDKPLTDAEDEFVEIFNPGSESIDLEGYIIQTGSKYSYSFTLPNITIAAKQYLAFYSLDSGLALSNSGGGARLLAPDKSPMYESPPYEKAKPDTVWVNIGGVWQWSAKPTPNSANVAASTGAAGRTSGSGTSGRTYLSQGKTLGASDDGRNVYEEPPTTADNQIDTAVVAGVGAMALLYAGNEYRYDMANFVSKIKRYFASRRGGGAAA